MKTKLRSTTCCLRLAPLFLAMASAHANPNDALQLSASYSIAHDDNLFRLTDRSAAQALVGRATPAETIKTGTAGIAFEKKYGLQQINLEASVVNYDYQNFSYLGFNALNYQGNLAWQLTPRFHGYLITRRASSTSSYGDLRNFSVRNERITHYNAADALYELDGAWRLKGTVSRIDLKNSATIIEQRAFTINSIDLGVLRTFSSGSEFAYRLRRGSGDYTAVSFSASAFLPSSYNSTEHELRLLWRISDKTRLESRVAYEQRKFNEFAFRDYSGVTGGSTLDWSVTSRINLRAAISRDLNDYQSSYSSYGALNRFTITPVWRIKEKLNLSLQQEFTKRQFKGNTPRQTTLSRDDSDKLTRLSLDWSPREFLSFSAWLQRTSRDSNFTGFSYSGNSAGVLAQVSF